eukprot:TRINITY_DN5155_c0_g1_i1.p1 TRINITY_DN5155_c0_g1~~TRINITY_DN5155_c0_g1_i1.p1  ORF type:complete len:222 (-),score=63.97 TRINITY_DN5155_c0_g1_i1:25-690(-)
MFTTSSESSSDGSNDELLMEIETLKSIYLDNFIKMPHRDNHYQIKIWPDPDGGDDVNRVGIALEIIIPDGYPNVIPGIRLNGLKGVNNQQCLALENIIREEAEEAVGYAMIYLLSTIVKDWVDENNDGDKRKVRERDEINVTFQEGTPVTPETWNDWWAGFVVEHNIKDILADDGRITGKKFFIDDGYTADPESDEMADVDWEVFEAEADEDLPDFSDSDE